MGVARNGVAAACYSLACVESSCDVVLQDQDEGRLARSSEQGSEADRQCQCQVSPTSVCHDSIALLEQNTTVTPVCDVGCVSSKACQSLPGI